MSDFVIVATEHTSANADFIESVLRSQGLDAEVKGIGAQGIADGAVMAVEVIVPADQAERANEILAELRTEE